MGTRDDGNPFVREENRTGREVFSLSKFEMGQERELQILSETGFSSRPCFIREIFREIPRETERFPVRCFLTGNLTCFFNVRSWVSHIIIWHTLPLSIKRASYMRLCAQIEPTPVLFLSPPFLPISANIKSTISTIFPACSDCRAFAVRIPVVNRNI